MPRYKRQFEIHTKAGRSFTVDVTHTSTAYGSSSHDTRSPSSGAHVDVRAPKGWTRRLLYLHKDQIAAIVETRERTDDESDDGDDDDD